VLAHPYVAVQSKDEIDAARKRYEVRF
jgi:hypothetical protein